MAGTHTYTASKARDAGRLTFSVIYRHPCRLDPSTGKVGRRVRRSLGTSDEARADELVAELSEILADRSYHALSARTAAEARFDPRVVSVFFDGMEPAEAATSLAERDRLLPLPGRDSARRVLLLGTTGAGKTTVVRQLLGTDPAEERFPSTSTAKTTIADTEIVLTGGDEFRAVVTFFRRDEVIDHLTDCASKAALAALRDTPRHDVRRLLLDHENQRFRFSYVLGRAETADPEQPVADFDDFEEQFDEADRFTAGPVMLSGIDLEGTRAKIEQALDVLIQTVTELEITARQDLDANDDEERVVREILEEELDQLLRQDERFNGVVDSLLGEIEARFDAVEEGQLVRDRQAWPKAWTLESKDRLAFLKAVNRFSSNYAPLFGQLLSPLVDGIRVAGPFRPTWLEADTPDLVLIDGEGLGHTPKSAAVLPTAVAKAIDQVDAVLLVDNATQPVQAAPAMAIRSILTSGNIGKLVFCFTHFDEVKGDNLRSAGDRARHVLASVENLVASFREEYHPRAERALRRRLSDARFFLAHIDQELDPADPSHRRTVSQMKGLIAALEMIGDRPDVGPARPSYDKTNLVLAITEAVRTFHRRWNALLGLRSESDIDKEHWTRIKALNRRFAEGTADQYDTLRPSAELRELLKDEIYRTLEIPLGWRGERPTDDKEVEAIIDSFSNAVANRLFEPIRQRLSVEPLSAWQAAYSLHGTGSTFVRARRIAGEIYAREVPVPGVTPGPDQNEFLHEVLRAIETAAEAEGVDLK